MTASTINTQGRSRVKMRHRTNGRSITGMWTPWEGYRSPRLLCGKFALHKSHVRARLWYLIDLTRASTGLLLTQGYVYGKNHWRPRSHLSAPDAVQERCVASSCESRRPSFCRQTPQSGSIHHRPIILLSQPSPDASKTDCHVNPSLHLLAPGSFDGIPALS